MDKNNKDNKVPLEQVLKDMYTNSGVESSARAYYYKVYATDEEREQMDREDKVTRIFGIGFVISFAAIVIMSIITGW